MKIMIPPKPTVDAHEAGLSASASVNTASTSDVIIIINVLIIVQLNDSMTKFVANAFSNRFFNDFYRFIVAALI